MLWGCTSGLNRGFKLFDLPGIEDCAFFCSTDRLVGSMSFQNPELSETPASEHIQKVSENPCSQLDDANCICIDNVDQSIACVHDSFMVVPGKPKELDCAEVKVDVTQTVHAGMQGSLSTRSLTVSVNMPFDGNDESQLSQDNSNVDLHREGSIGGVERELNIADVEARTWDIENDLPLSEEQNQPNQMKGVVQEHSVSFGDRVCRVCYLGTTAQPESGPPIELGCECKLDLAVAHQQCAEAWFKIRGNRICEICGALVNNVNGIGDATFIENWNDGDARAAEASHVARFWQSHRLFNILLAIMILAFVLPWLFHVCSFLT